jgi:hypothetical protein
VEEDFGDWDGDEEGESVRWERAEGEPLSGAEGIAERVPPPYQPSTSPVPYALAVAVGRGAAVLVGARPVALGVSPGEPDSSAVPVGSRVGAPESAAEAVTTGAAEGVAPPLRERVTNAENEGEALPEIDAVLRGERLAEGGADCEPEVEGDTVVDWEGRGVADMLPDAVPLGEAREEREGGGERDSEAEGLGEGVGGPSVTRWVREGGKDATPRGDTEVEGEGGALRLSLRDGTGEGEERADGEEDPDAKGEGEARGESVTGALRVPPARLAVKDAKREPRSDWLRDGLHVIVRQEVTVALEERNTTGDREALRESESEAVAEGDDEGLREGAAEEDALLLVEPPHTLGA